ncbi:MAG: peptidylprolyl isomerase [Bacteroidales bacterium]|nr:peptidylprolyl isomerase [Bacteroidales bacterium]
MKRILIFFTLLFLTLVGLTQAQPDSSVLSLQATDAFQVEFQTTAGSFTIEAYRNWSPEGADRLYQLVRTDFFTDVAIFRVQPEYVVQFGISDNPQVNGFWEEHPLPDEPVKQSNLKGTVAYAREGADSRTTQLFINYQDNFKLDTINFNGLRGFPPIGRVVDGMEVVESFYSDYGFEPAEKQDSIYQLGNAYLRKKYPGLDYIRKAKIVGE